MKIDKPMSIMNLVVFFGAFAWLIFSNFLIGEIFTGQIVYSVLGLFAGVIMLNVIFMEKKIVALGVPMPLPTNQPSPVTTAPEPVVPQFNETPQQIPARQPTEDEMIEQVVLTRLQQGHELQSILEILVSAGKNRNQVVQVINSMASRGIIKIQQPEPVAPVQQTLPAAPEEEEDSEVKEEKKEDEPEDKEKKNKRIRERREGKVQCPKCEKKFADEKRMKKHYGMAHYAELDV